MTDEELNQIRGVLREALDAAVESIGADFSELRGEMGRRFDATDRRLDAIERRMESVETTVTAMRIEIGGFSRSLTAAERLDSSITGTQAAQQKAIDDLGARLRAVEKRLEKAG